MMPSFSLTDDGITVLEYCTWIPGLVNEHCQRLVVSEIKFGL